MRFLTALMAVSLFATGPAAAAQLAVTEFLANPAGSDAQGEWLELFNYGATGISLAGWQLADADSNRASLPATTLRAGGYLVVARDKPAFQSRWLGGADDPRVREVRGTLTLSNAADELILETPDGTVAWQLAYGGSVVSEGTSVFLDPDSGFVHTEFGTKASPGVVLGGPDSSATTGYEACVDDVVCAGLTHSSAGETGSPLAGAYQVQPAHAPRVSVPAPVTLLCLSAGISAWLGAAGIRDRRPRLGRAVGGHE